MSEETSPSLTERLLAAMNPPVFFGSAGLVVGFVAFSAIFTERAEAAFQAAQSTLTENFGWAYLLSTTLLLVGVVYLGASRLGSVKLGSDDDEPEFSFPAWFSMMMAAGMGIGVIFFGVAEPLAHYASPPVGEGRTTAATVEAMRYTFFHWGLHPWAIYCAIALPIAYFHHRMDLPLAPRSLLFPLIGDRMEGWAGHVVDVVCTVGTLFGVATSLGLGAIQINAGLGRLFDLPQATNVQLILIGGITLVATLSVVSGIKVGIRWLSGLNMSLAGLLLVFILVAGPTLFAIDLLFTGLGRYVNELPSMTLSLAPEAGDWRADWTLFYWAWWLSWSPFVGIFTARISKGRTVRQFVVAAMLVPTLMAFVWFATVGGTGLHFEHHLGQAIYASTRDNPSLSLFTVLEQLPWSGVTTVLATATVIIFFITSSDSGSLVDDMVTSGGHPNPPRLQRVFWAVAEGTVAATLLVAGGLHALRTASLVTGLPMAVLLLATMAGFLRSLRRDVATDGRPDLDDLR